MPPPARQPPTFACFLCPANGLTSSAMEKHLQMIHNESSNKNQDNKKGDLFCLICDFSTDSQNQLHDHVIAKHSEEKMCNSCHLLNDAETAANHMELYQNRELVAQTGDCKEHAGISNAVDNSCSVQLSTDKALESFVQKDDSCSMTADHLGSAQDLQNESLRLSDCPEMSFSESQMIGAKLEVNDEKQQTSDMEDDMWNFEDVEEKSSQPKKYVQSETSLSDANSFFTQTSFASLNVDGHAKNYYTTNCSQIAMEAIKKCHGETSSGNILNRHVSLTNIESNHNSSIKNVKNMHSVENVTTSSNSAETNQKMFECPFCSFHTMSEGSISQHVAYEHMPMEESLSTQFEPDNCTFLYSCPFCCGGFETPKELSCHIDINHPDAENQGSVALGTNLHDSKGRASLVSTIASTDNTSLACPICGIAVASGDESFLQEHVNEHFEPNVYVQDKDRQETGKDRQIAEQLQSQEKQKIQKEKEDFEELPSRFGMDTNITARQHFNKDLVKAVTRGEISSAEFHVKRATQLESEQTGEDDGSSRVTGILEKLRDYYGSKNGPHNIARAYLCSNTDHYSGSYGDRGWGCGYRNMQMLLSSMKYDPVYFQVLFNGQDKIPSIYKIQQLIEAAWRVGFDPQGCEQLEGKLINTRKWIGATEIVVALSSLHIKCQLLDFHAPSGPNATHPVMINWVRDYFKNSFGIIHPLYLQHQGHSRTIVGLEELQNGNCNLLLFDPGMAKARMEPFLRSFNTNTMQTIRRSINALKARQYQIVAVSGILNDKEFEESKRLRSNRLS